MEKIKKIFNQKTRNILSIIIIILGVAFLINYIFYTPSYINAYIATNIYKEPANKYFDDDNFYKCVVDAYNRENKKSIPYTQNLSDSQLGSIKWVDCSGYNKSDNAKVKSAKGVEKLTALTWLDVNHNQLTTLDVSKNTALTRLDVWRNQLTTLDVSNNTALTCLYIGSATTFSTLPLSNSNQLTTLDVSNNIKLSELHIESNQLTTLDVSNNTKLTRLDVGANQLTTLDVSNNTALTDLYVSSNKLTTLDVSKNTALTKLWVNNNQLITLDVSKNTKLTSLIVSDNQLTTLDVSNNTALTKLWVNNNQLITLDVSKNTALTDLGVGGNQLTTIDVSKNTALTWLRVNNNQLTTLDVSKNTALTDLGVGGNQLTTIDVSKNTALTWLRVNNNQLTTLDVSKNTALTDLWLYNNQLTTLDVSNNTALTGLWLYNNNLTNLDFSKNTNLLFLNAHNNKLNKLSINSDIEALMLDYDLVPNVELSNNSKLKNVSLWKRKYVYLEDNFVFDDIPKEYINKFNLDFSNLSWEYPESISSQDNKNFKASKLGNYVIHGIYNPGDKYTTSNGVTGPKERLTYDIYVVKITSNKYNIDEKNKNIFNTEGVSDKDILNNINIEYGSIDEKYKILTKEIKDNKLVIKHNDKVIREYNLVKIEIKSKHYSINGDNIVYVNDFDINEIDLNYGSKEVKDNKLVIKYNDKVIKEYKLYGIKTKYSVINNTIYVGEIINTEDELRECIKNCSSATDQVGCADDCEMRYNILDHITSSDLKLSIDKDKLICKYNNEIINEFVLSSKNEYDIIDDYTKENDIISRIPIDTDMNVFKTKINTNIGYLFKDSKNNDIVTNRKLRTGDKVIFNYSSGDIDYVLSVIGDVNGDGIIDGKDIMEISNGIVGNKKLDNLGSLSGDIDNNSKMDIKDIIKMGNYIKKGKF
jgi:Leucine-rich repeat (LRR) protein